MITEIKIPEIGENVTEGTVVGVLVAKGDSVDAEQSIIEFETDKAVVEIPSPAKGKIVDISVKKGDTIAIDEVIARLETADDAGAAAEDSKDKPVEKAEQPAEQAQADASDESEEVAAEAEEEPEPVEQPQPQSRTATEEPSMETREPHTVAPASPSVRRLARELGADINRVPASGPGGRITVEDVKAYVKDVVTGQTSQGGGGGQRSARRLPDFARWGDIRREKMSRVRMVTSDSVGYSWNVVPHVTQFDRADISSFDAFRDKYGKLAEKAGGKLTITAVLIKILSAALKRFPKFNASIDIENGEIVFKDYVHIGMAVDTDRGLLVPVIRDVDKKSIVQLSADVVALAGKARDKKISPDEMEGGTFTISNQGGIGGTNFTPIVLWPQVAILGVSRGAVEPVFTDGEFRPRTILPLSLSYDHRVVDGADAARFLRWVCEALENPLVMHLDSQED